MKSLTLQNIKRGLRLIRMLDFDPHSNLGPLRVDIAATSACNYRCIFCGFHSYLMAKPVKPQYLDSNILYNLLIDLCNLGTKEILFAGNGEPFLSSAALFAIKNNELYNRFEILTNGSMLDQVDKELFKHFSKLTVSLNSGNGKTHQSIHGYKGDNQFLAIINNIQRILDFPSGSNKVELNYVITKENQNELDDFYRLAEKWKIHYNVRPVDAYVFPQLELTPGKQRTELYPCYLGFIQTTITADGSVLQCYGCGHLPLGNLNQQSFKDIWQSGRNIRFQAVAMGKSGKPIIHGCIGCANAKASSVSFHNYYSKIPILNRRVI